MTQPPLSQRQKTYFHLCTHLAQMDTAQLYARFNDPSPMISWGKTHTIQIGEVNVFVKRIPVTEIEFANPFSTQNLYDLPMFYNYGVGSVGFGVFRELVTHIKTTNWVLEGAIENFPLMYHFRIVPYPGLHETVDMERHERYVTYWGGDAHIGQYMLDRANAPYEALLFLEHLPFTASPWLLENPQKVGHILEDMFATIAFLRKNGIIHLDLHLSNVMTDGQRAYLTDFGLALDKSFALSPAESTFLKRNTLYDYGELIRSLEYSLFQKYRQLSDEDKTRLLDAYGIGAEVGIEDRILIFLTHLETILASGLLTMDPQLVRTLLKYRPIITLMHNFYLGMRTNHRKDTPYKPVVLRRLLREAGVLA